MIAVAALASVSSISAVDYNRDVRPILSTHCFSCHGFDESSRKAQLRLDVAESAYADRDGFTAITPRDPAKSEAWLRINSPHDDEVMPPPEVHTRLTTAEKDTLRQWIEEGAAYAAHWSLIGPRKLPLPSPQAHPIDAFVRARLASESLAPAPGADRRTLIRRLSFDLLGLPPTAAEVEAFVTDRDPRAYEKLVDRLLRSEHFGERMALDWLDAARYADTSGFSVDGGRHMWLWRDWVIQSFNDNLPYDRFLTEQLAGDLIPNRSEAQLIATGFQRNTMVTFEGGTIPEENLTIYNADRVKTLGEAVLGLTVGCAQCHDHKYDPISQKDYYQLFAYFNSLSEKPLDGNGGINATPSIQARTVLRSKEEPVLRREIAALRRQLDRVDQSIVDRWSGEQLAMLARRGRDFAAHEMKLLSVATSSNRGAGSDLRDGNKLRPPPNDRAAYDLALELPRGRSVTGIRVVFYPVSELPGGGWGRGPSAFKPRNQEEDNGDSAPPLAANGLKKGNFMLTAITVSADAQPNPQLNLHKTQSIARVTANTWQPQRRPADCLDPRNESGWSPDLAAEGPARLTATFAQSVDAASMPFLTVQLNFGHGQSLVPGLVQVLAITGEDDDTDLPAEIVAALGTPQDERTAEQANQLTRYCADYGRELDPVRIALSNLEERLAVLTQPFSTMVMDVAKKPRDTFILHRGDYSQPTVKVTPGTLSALPPLPPGASADRLGLAQWITMKEHPLTARVAVNRIWKLFFGAGLVRTPADFGMQGEWPTHPELLDWLAVDFVERGWDVKALVRLMVTSETYRQKSTAAPAALERDPQNRLLARGPRFRLAAEFIRDAALATSGLLVPRLGGPSVNPYAPGDLWREISFYGTTPATAQTFVQDHGEKLYRRSMYTYWKRSAPPPNLVMFDAPNRELCTIDRAATTTPLQTLVLLNDPQFVEAARAFAERMLTRPGDDETRLRSMMSEALARGPSGAELSVLQRALERERARYATNAPAAEKFLSVGESPRNSRLPAAEHAAWAQVAGLVFNLSEFVTRN